MSDEPLSQTLAALVGLLCNFRQLGDQKKETTHRDFIEWLEYHRHEDVKNLIINTHNLPREIDDLLRRDQQDILQKLAELNIILASILSKMGGFGGIVAAVGPEGELSEQAKEILLEFVELESDFVTLYPQRGQVGLLYSPGGVVSLNEQRFVEGDLRTLVRYGFFSEERNSRGETQYKVTRSGDRYARLLESSGGR